MELWRNLYSTTTFGVEILDLRYYWNPDYLLITFNTLQIRNPKTQKKLRESAMDAIHGVRGGMALLAMFLNDEYLPAYRKDIGVSSLPEGRDFYQACIG